jgi:RNA polymerase sigma factor (TIGR02999 family)
MRIGSDPKSPHPGTVDDLLEDLRQGRREAFEGLLAILYDELKSLARRERRRRHGHDTLNTTALVHEAYMKLAGSRSARFESRAHFMATAARAIRQILVNHARDKGAIKRGGSREGVSLDVLGEAELPGLRSRPPSDRLLDLDRALERLAAVNERASRIVECRFFGGMTIGETAVALDVSTATVTRAWALAQAWLLREMTGRAAEQAGD